MLLVRFTFLSVICYIHLSLARFCVQICVCVCACACKCVCVCVHNSHKVLQCALLSIPFTFVLFVAIFMKRFYFLLRFSFHAIQSSFCCVSFFFISGRLAAATKILLETVTILNIIFVLCFIFFAVLFLAIQFFAVVVVVALTALPMPDIFLATAAISFLKNHNHLIFRMPAGFFLCHLSNFQQFPCFNFQIHFLCFKTSYSFFPLRMYSNICLQFLQITIVSCRFSPFCRFPLFPGCLLRSMAFSSRIVCHNTS